MSLEIMKRWWASYEVPAPETLWSRVLKRSTRTDGLAEWTAGRTTPQQLPGPTGSCGSTGKRKRNTYPALCLRLTGQLAGVTILGHDEKNTVPAQAVAVPHDTGTSAGTMRRMTRRRRYGHLRKALDVHPFPAKGRSLKASKYGKVGMYSSGKGFEEPLFSCRNRRNSPLVERESHLRFLRGSKHGGQKLEDIRKMRRSFVTTE